MAEGILNLEDLEKQYSPPDREGEFTPAWMLGPDWREQARYGIGGTPFQAATSLAPLVARGNLAGQMMYDRETGVSSGGAYPTAPYESSAPADGEMGPPIPKDYVAPDPKRPPIDNSLTIKDYAALASAAGILGAMFMPKPKAPHQVGGRTYQGGGGNVFLRRHV